MQTYKVFLASSEELKDDREKFELHGLVKTGGGNFTGRDHITSGTPPKPTLPKRKKPGKPDWASAMHGSRAGTRGHGLIDRTAFERAPELAEQRRRHRTHGAVSRRSN